MLDAATLVRVPAPETGFFGSLYLDFLSDQPFVSSRFPGSYRKDETWNDRARLRLGPARPEATAELWKEAAEAHARWGASDAARRGIEDLASGKAVAVVAGQQPDALGGPVFTLAKVLTAAALARRIEIRTGVRAVPVFWCATEDSDFEEIRTVRFFGPALEPGEAVLPESAHQAGGLVGSIAIPALGETWEKARAAWKGLPGAALAGEWIERAAARAQDLGEVQAMLVLQATASLGVVAVDPRWPAFRRAARGVYERYLERYAQVRESVEQAGQSLAEHGYGQAVEGPQSEFSLFEVVDGVRAKLDPARARQAFDQGKPIIPNVVLRPVAQDSVLPAAALVAGPGEVAYLAQLRGVYEALDVPMSGVFPRLSSTWLPQAAMSLVREFDLSPWELVKETDKTIKDLVSRMVPAPVRHEFERLRREANEGLRHFADPAATVDTSLPQLVESVRSKVDFQYGRLLEALVTKRKAAFERAHPAQGRLRHALMPQGRAQERRVTWLDLLAHEGPDFASAMADLATLHVEQSFAGDPAHYLVHPTSARGA
jgi:uncharacterized protein YllA (UPF0747 family)